MDFACIVLCWDDKVVLFSFDHDIQFLSCDFCIFTVHFAVDVHSVLLLL